MEIGTAAFKNSGLREVTVPSKATQLGSEIFADTALHCAEIKGRRIGAAMFRGCRQLTRVQLDRNIRIIEKGAFRECSALKTLRLPEKLERIEEEAFWNCERLERVAMPEGVKEIGDGAFYGRAFENICVPEKIAEIQHETFGECKKLKTIHFPAELKRIDGDAFYGCPALKMVRFDAELTAVQKIQIGEGNESLTRALLSCGGGNKAGNVP